MAWEQLAQRASELAEDTERARRMPGELSRALGEAGLYRLCVPTSLGGSEAEPRELVDAVETLATGDAATAWCVAVCATAGMLAAYLPQDAAREIYGDPRGVVGGVFAPMGRAVRRDDMYDVTGRWRFASNIVNCDWLMGGCLVDGDVRLALFPASAAEVFDTWSVSGLRGTGSHDMAVEGLAVPAERTASLITDEPREAGPLYAFPPFGLLAASIAAVALGTARGALGDLTALAGGKTPTMSTRTLAQRATTQAAVARAEAALRAARAGLHEAIASAWSVARADGAITLADKVALRLAATHAAETSATVTADAFRLAGGSAIYDTSPLQRRFRDVHAANQHMLVGPATWELAGRALLGLDVDDAQL